MKNLNFHSILSSPFESEEKAEKLENTGFFKIVSSKSDRVYFEEIRTGSLLKIPLSKFFTKKIDFGQSVFTEIFDKPL